MTDKILVTGGGTFLGDSIAAALLAAGAEVTLLVRPGAEDNLGGLADRVRVFTGDVWTPASLKGRARGHQHVIHTVGGLRADPSQGLTYQWLNFVSARNVANLCVNAGVQHLVLISGARAPWLNGGYIAAKREAEDYIQRVGLRTTIIRAPLVYLRGSRRPLFYQLMTLLGKIPPISWLGMARIAPMPVDVLARGVARLTLQPRGESRVFYAGDLRRMNSMREQEHGRANEPQYIDDSTKPKNPFRHQNEETPFGWTPSSDSPSDDTPSRDRRR
ncbi:MAG: NAD(P)H-binding protein [Anaerolinea sp.]|nr:NAD(P)H-binding protein [Anaerolinea sp.]